MTSAAPTFSAQITPSSSFQLPAPSSPRVRVTPQSSSSHTSPRSRSPKAHAPALMDIEAVLRSHGGDVRRALDAVIAERNALVGSFVSLVLETNS